MDKKIFLNRLYEDFKDFKKTALYIQGAQSIVFGEGDPNSPIVFVGEAPGAEEDIAARPFVGRSGRLLTKTIESFGVSREKVFITNIVKCRPPENRQPTVQEVKISKELLLQHELLIINPKIIVPLGLCALNALVDDICIMSKLRGKIMQSHYGPLLPTYHPAYILRNINAYDTFCDDIKLALEIAHMI